MNRLGPILLLGSLVGCATTSNPKPKMWDAGAAVFGSSVTLRSTSPVHQAPKKSTTPNITRWHQMGLDELKSVRPRNKTVRHTRELWIVLLILVLIFIGLFPTQEPKRRVKKYKPWKAPSKRTRK